MREANLNILNSLEQLRQLISVFSCAFESEYTVADEYLERMLVTRSTIIIGAMKDQKVIGGLVAFEMCPIHGSKELYLYDIAVHPNHQKQGIGTKLIELLREEAKAKGVTTIFVEAESEDVGAVAFYRKLGGEEMAVNHFNFNL
jgi:aminoglycoside 3-N-acetyltransferase I